MEKKGTDVDIEREHTVVLKRLVAETYCGLGKRLDVMNEEMQETKQQLLEIKQELQATRLEL